MSVKLLIVSIFTFNVSSVLSTYRVLFIPAHDTNSHTKSMYPMAEMLALDGNDVVMLQLMRAEGYFSKEILRGDNVTDRFIYAPPLPKGDPIDDEQHFERLWTTRMQRPMQMFWPWITSGRVCKDMLNNPEAAAQFAQVIKEHWDLIVVDDLFTYCGAAVVALNGAPWVIMSTTFLQYTRILELKGVQPPPAYVPGMRTLGHFEHDNFYHRLWSTLDAYSSTAIGMALDWTLPRWIQHELTRNATVASMQRKSTLALGVLPAELDFGKPLSPDILDVDNDCAKTAGPLEEPYRSFVEDPRSNGTIVFSVGHYVNWDFAPPSALNAFVEAFQELREYRIIWQFVSSKPQPKMGSHVMMGTWIPQQQLLEHPNTKVFISHGGLKSLKETLCSGLPMIGLPFFAEQSRNVALSVKKGFGLYLDKTRLKSEDILSDVRSVMEDRAFAENAQKTRRFLLDKLYNPLKLGKFWVSFLLNHGATRVQEHTMLKMSTCSFFGQSFDVVFIAALVIFLLIKVLS